MAAEEPSPCTRVVTTHNPTDTAIFSSTLSETLPVVATPFAVPNPVYTTTSAPANLASDADIHAHAEKLTQPFAIHVGNLGLSGGIVNLRPNSISPFHRTTSLDIGVIVSSVVELVLDSREARTLRQGNCVVQRSSMPPWKNLTPESENGGWAKLFLVNQEIQPLHFRGNVLGEEWDGKIKEDDEKL